MKQENYVSTTKVVTVLLWVTVGILICAAWVTMMVEPPNWKLAAMLSVTASTLASVAAVAHVRLYALRVLSLIRLTSGLTRPSDDADSGPRLHRVKP